MELDENKYESINVISLDRENASSLVRGFKFDKLIFWIGAGADCLSPTNLPTSGQLVRSILKTLLLEDYTEQIISKWDECMHIIGADGAPPRMESVLEAIRVCESNLKFNEQKSVNISEGLRFFDDAPSNENTQILGWAASRGSAIITTNYSHVIERESIVFLEPHGSINYEVNTSLETISCSHIMSNGVPVGTVTHIHGVSEHPETMGITLKTISRDFPDDFRQELNRLIDDPTHLFIFFGYSGSDNYDVNPLFQAHRFNRDCRNTGATALYIRYGTGIPQSLKPGEKALLGAFSKRYICCCERLSNVFSPIKPICGEHSFIQFNWIDSFRKHATLPISEQKKKDLADILALAISEYFGINIFDGINLTNERMNYLRRYFSDEGHWYIDFYGIRYLECIGDIERLRANNQAAASLSDDQLLFEGGGADAVAWNAIPQDLVLRALRTRSESEESFWHSVTTPENHWISEFERSIFSIRDLEKLHNMILGEKGNLNRISTSSQIMLSLSYGRFSALRQVAVELRVHGRASGLLAVLYGHSPFGMLHQRIAQISLDEAIRSYIDISSMRGLTRAYVERAYIMALWYAFITKDSHYYDESKSSLETALGLAHSTGNERSISQCHFIQQFILFLLPESNGTNCTSM